MTNAIKNRNPQFMKALLSNGACDVNSVTEAGDSALSLAVLSWAWHGQNALERLFFLSNDSNRVAAAEASYYLLDEIERRPAFKDSASLTSAWETINLLEAYWSDEKCASAFELAAGDTTKLPQWAAKMDADLLRAEFIAASKRRKALDTMEEKLPEPQNAQYMPLPSSEDKPVSRARRI